jgi:hypothetical protein
MVVPIDTPEVAKPICRPMFFSSTFSQISAKPTSQLVSQVPPADACDSDLPDQTTALAAPWMKRETTMTQKGVISINSSSPTSRAMTAMTSGPRR